MKLIILAPIIMMVFMSSCTSRDDKQAMSNIWHMGKALTSESNEGGFQDIADANLWAENLIVDNEKLCAFLQRAILIGGELRRIAEQHEKEHGYVINKGGKRYVGTN